MRLGMNMLLWSDNVVDEKYVPIFESLREMGYDGVEVPVFEATPSRYEALGERLDEIGLERTAVTARSESENPISADPAVRAAGVAATKAALDCCEAGGMQLLAGPFQGPLGTFTGEGATGEEWVRGVESMREVAEHAERRGVTLALEFLNRFEIYFLNCASDAARFVKEVDHPRCRMMYDTFHAHIEEKNVPEAIRACADVLAHVHISENDRSTPGQGQVNWEETFAALAEVDYDGWLTVEAFGLALPSLAAATRIWRRTFESEEQLARDALAFMRSSLASA